MALRGFSTIIGIIFLMMLSGIVLVTTSAQNISQLHIQLAEQQSLIAEQNAESCKEESLRHLKDDVSYSGGTIVLPDGSACTVDISDAETGKIMIITASHLNSTKSVTVELEVSTLLSAVNIKVTNISE